MKKSVKCFSEYTPLVLECGRWSLVHCRVSAALEPPVIWDHTSVPGEVLPNSPDLRSRPSPGSLAIPANPQLLPIFILPPFATGMLGPSLKPLAVLMDQVPTLSLALKLPPDWSDQSLTLPCFCPQTSALLSQRSFLLPLNFYPFPNLSQVKLHCGAQGQASSVC